MNRKEFRSDCGKLLFIKSERGYEIKCPRDKKIYVIPYETMIKDFLDTQQRCEKGCIADRIKTMLQTSQQQQQ